MPHGTNDKIGENAAFRAPNGTSAAEMSATTKPIILPPNTSLETFQAFIKRLGDTLTAENVTIVTSKDELTHENYMDPSKVHDMYHILEQDEFVASAVVAPRHVPDVQTIMRAANEFKIPVWPFCKSPP